MTPQSVKVHIDDRARLISAVLAATDWPDREQQRQRHRAHAHARSTARRVAAFVQHPAVSTLQRVLNDHTPLDTIYSVALSLSSPDLRSSDIPAWMPEGWTEQLADFAERAALVAWWHDEDAAWQAAREQTQSVVDGLNLGGFFEKFVGRVQDDLILMPNIGYPSDIEIGVRLGGQLFCLIPPRISWGDNEPWPFDEDAVHVIRGAVSQYARLLITAYLDKYPDLVASAAGQPLPVSANFRRRHPTWSAQFAALFESASVALFLEHVFGPPEAKAYILMEHRINGLGLLASVVNVLQRYLVGYDKGRYNALAEYLPEFSNALHTVKTTISP